MKPRSVDVIIPSKSGDPMSVPTRNDYPWIAETIIATAGDGWVGAVNSALGLSDRDVLLMDDDVVLIPGVFNSLEENFQKADIFGFKLLYPNGITIQHAGGVVDRFMFTHRYYNWQDIGQAEVPMYMAHCTASLLYIKRGVIDIIGGMQKLSDYGRQFEDVDFSFRALLAGFNIMYLPGGAIHYESNTKGKDPAFKRRMRWNYFKLVKRYMFNKKLWRIVDGIQSV